MKRLLLALALLPLTQTAHSLIIQGGAEYDDGSTYTFTTEIDDSYAWKEGANGAPSGKTLMTFTHGDYIVSSIYGGGVLLLESSTDTGSIFGDSLEDSWESFHIDFPADDYHFSSTQFISYGGNIDPWRPRNSGRYTANAIRSFLRVGVSEPNAVSLLLLCACGLLIHRKMASRSSKIAAR